LCVFRAPLNAADIADNDTSQDMLVFGGDVQIKGRIDCVIRQLLDFATTLSGPRAFRNGKSRRE
jgi:hypothetical protein